ncbi:MAG: hypothetical protein ABI456_01270 [Ktedonobacteraceae bacterium]|nr:hypothetical protein [Chloroflexota bacterium]
MLSSKQLWFLGTGRVGRLQTGRPGRLQVIVPLCAGGLMLVASFLPWLNDPLMGAYAAWSLPVDAGWQFRAAALSYGSLCLCCACYALLLACAAWRPLKVHISLPRSYIAAGCLCLVPIVLFLFQYLCSDTHGISDLAQHKVQVLLVEQHFGYKFPRDRIFVAPFMLDVTTLTGRGALLINQLSIGVALPCISAWLLIVYKRFSTLPARTSVDHRRRACVWTIAVCVLLLVIGRGTAALACEYEARVSLADGRYTQTLNWLHAALILNPSLNQGAAYHIERGQALYFLAPQTPNDDSRAYLAHVYATQKDYADGYQQLLVVWQHQRETPWVLAEMSTTLAHLAEFAERPGGSVVARPAHDDTGLAWLQLLHKIAPANVYGQYMFGRVQCNLHNYALCAAQMNIVLKLGANTDIWSSAYTYIATSEMGQGRYTLARDLLFKAEQLDPDYRNTTAREELSGLH